ncbi:unnamed protein product [Orchesella dallaii]|uniref:Apolipoprotein D n=1 Tax=Orchesella dallaii TaxID=48710 RepID=A0ABP1QZ01_9HEXA
MQSSLVTLLIFGACGYVTAQVQFQAEAYSEGGCVKPPPPQQIDANWLVSQKTFYVPLASQCAFRRFSETFLSRAGTTEDDVHSMCLTIDMVSSGPGLNVTNTGFDLRDFRQSCQAGSEAGHFFCIPVSGTAGTNPPRAGKADYYITATDNQSYLFIVRCVDSFFKDYLLLSTRPAISQDVHQKAVQSLRELGFDDRRVEVMPYQSCLRSDRFISTVSNVPNNNRGSGGGPPTYGIPPFPQGGPFIGGSNDLRGLGGGFGGPFPGPAF